jgi:hypothetical protein
MVQCAHVHSFSLNIHDKKRVRAILREVNTATLGDLPNRFVVGITIRAGVSGCKLRFVIPKPEL